MECSVINERCWEILLSEIEKGNVVPIIGNELLKVRVGEEEVLLNEYLLRHLAEKIGIEYTDKLDFTRLSGLEYSHLWKREKTDMYYETNVIIKNTTFGIPDVISQLLKIDKFRLLLTTTIDTTLEKACIEKWGEGNFHSLRYFKGKNGEDINDLNKPVLYHMFGKVAGTPQHSYVLTEDDLLEFLHCWLTENYKPQKLSNILRDKYLLVLGCNFPNWLFRFFLHSMKYTAQQSFTDGRPGMVVNSHMDEELISFLSRIDAEMYDDAEKFINELVYRWEKHSLSSENKTDLLNNEVFISYASEDIEHAIEISTTFNKLGVNIWFDKKDLEPADEYAEKIKKNIRSCKVFVPVLSKNVLTRDRRFFKREWSWAIEESEWRNPAPFIFPVTIDDMDIQNDLIPQSFSQHQKIDYRNVNFEEEIKKVVRIVRR